MFESQANSEMWYSNLLVCHACLSWTRTLTAVGEYVHIYRTICDNIGMDSQINICWECLALLKKVQAFKRKVENAQKILDLSAKETVLEHNLSNLTLSSIETTTFDLPVLDEEENEYGNFMDTLTIIEPYCDLSKDLKQPEDTYNLVNFEDSLCEIMIENVRSYCEILDVKPVLDWSISSSEVTDKVEPLDSPVDKDQSQHRRWKRSVLLVFKRICSHPHAVHFMRPVTDDIAPHYSNIVRRPTDLTTIRQRIKDGVIRTTTEFTRALLLMFSNALMYNSSHHEIYGMTVEFREEALRELSLLIEAQAMAAWPLAAPPAPSAAPLHFTRRASARERPKDEFMKTPAPLRGRRSTLFEPPQTPKPKENRSTLDRKVPAAVTRPTSMEPSKPVKHNSAKKGTSDQMKAAPLRGRRSTVYEASMQPSKPVKHHSAKKGTSDQMKAAPLRGRRSTVYEASMQPPKPVKHHSAKKGTSDQMKAAPLRGRRSTVYEASMQPPKPVKHHSAKKGTSDQMKAAPLRGRRSTVYEASMQPPKPVKHHSAKKGTSDQMKAAPLRGRRSTVYEASMQPSKPVKHHSAKKGTSDQMKAAPLRGRRSTVYEASMQPSKPVKHHSAKKGTSDQMKAAPLRGRRSTVYEASMQPSKPVKHHSAKKGTSDQMKAAPLRGRRATVYETSMQPTQLTEHSYAINLFSDKSNAAPLGGRRSTVYDTSTQAPETVDHSKKHSSDQIKAAPLRTRRATVFESKQNIQPVESSKKRPKWDWPSLEDEYLIAKKFKHAVAVL